MHSSVELVKESVLTILPALPPSEAIAVAKVLVSDVGVDSVADLQFVEATDLTTLKPIQVRKLIQSWKCTGESQPFLIFQCII